MKKGLFIKFLSVALSCGILFFVGCNQAKSPIDDGQTGEVNILDTNVVLCENGKSSYKIFLRA